MSERFYSAGPGLDSGEFVALTATTDELMVRVNQTADELGALRAELEHIIITVHQTYHRAKGVSKRPRVRANVRWEDCQYMLCRRARKVLLDEG